MWRDVLSSKVPRWGAIKGLKRATPQHLGDKWVRTDCEGTKGPCHNKYHVTGPQGAPPSCSGTDLSPAVPPYSQVSWSVDMFLCHWCLLVLPFPTVSFSHQNSFCILSSCLNLPLGSSRATFTQVWGRYSLGWLLKRPASNVSVIQFYLTLLLYL